MEGIAIKVDLGCDKCRKKCCYLAGKALELPVNNLLSNVVTESGVVSPKYCWYFDGKGCGCYDSRPLECRQYPYRVVKCGQKFFQGIIPCPEMDFESMEIIQEITSDFKVSNEIKMDTKTEEVLQKIMEMKIESVEDFKYFLYLQTVLFINDTSLSLRKFESLYNEAYTMFDDHYLTYMCVLSKLEE